MIKILIYGAGVIGSLYAAFISDAGYDITIYARGNRLKVLREQGLLYKHKAETKKAKVKIIDKLENKDEYDFIFLTVRGEQIETALKEIKKNKSKTVVTMANSIDDYSKWESLCGEGRILPAFPGAGGSIENGVLNADLTPYLIQPTTFGEISGIKSQRVKTLAKIFKKSHIPYQIVPNMHYWQLSHLGLVVPIADAYYMTSTPSEVYNDKNIMHETAKSIKNNFIYFRKKSMLSPRKFYLLTICPISFMSKILKYVFKSEFGNKFMYQHAMNAPMEMKELHKNLYNYMNK